MHSTNYFNTLICPAEDCKSIAKVPTKPGSVAALQYDTLARQPYSLTSDDLLSMVAATRKGVDNAGLAAFREAFFSKGQPCLRASPLTKTHGWAVHADDDSRIALISPQNPEFEDLMRDDRVKKVYAMRNKRV